MERLLSAGALQQILDGMKPANPVLQIIGYKPMGPEQTSFGSSTEELRYRLMIGDGLKTHQYCVITNQDLVQDIQNGKIEKWSIVRVTAYQTHDCDGDANKRRLIYICNMEIVERGSSVGKKLTVEQPIHVAGDKSYFASPNNPVQPQNNFNRQAENNNPTQPQPYPMQQQQHMNSAVRSSPRPMRSSHDNQSIGIGELTPYIGKWIIKGRVTSKSAVREYNNAKGGGKLFNFILADKTGEIKVTGFNTECERYHPYIVPNKVYVLGRASVKNADKRYTTADFEITLNSDSLLEEITDSVGDMPMARFNFISIGSLASDQPPAQPVDLIGAIQSVSDVAVVISKTKNKELKKRNVVIVDGSRHSISVTIWGESAESFEGTEGDIFVTKGARIGTYGGRSASAGDCIFINPDIPEARKVKNWYSNLIDQNFTSLTSSQDSLGSSGDQWKSIALLNDLEHAKNIVSSGQNSALYGRCKAMLTSIGKNPVYKCCPTEGCGKKLVDTQSGDMKCEKCQQTYNQFKYRYKTDVEIEDFSGSSWITLWDEKAEVLFGMKPEELERYMKMENKEVYERVITKPNFNTFLFTVRSRIDTYNNEERVKLTVVNIAPMEPVSYSKRLMDEIKSLSQ